MLSSAAAAISTRLKLEEATSSKDDVTPVYLTDQVVALATSTPDGAATTLDFLLRKLAPGSSAIVKTKALRLLKACCSAGPSEFKRRAARQAAGPVRELTHWQAPPDPLVGDAHNARVRAAAKDALEAVFSAAAAPAQQRPGGGASGGGPGARIQGFGSGSSAAAGGYSGGGGGGTAHASSSSSGMIGFGNPRFENGSSGPPPPNLATARGVLEAAARGAAALATQAAGAAVAMAAEHGINLPPLPVGGSGLGAGGLANSRPGGGLGGYGPPLGAPGGYAGGDAGSPYRPTSAGSPSPSPPRPAPAPRAPTVPGAREEALVDAVCAPGGLRAAPTAAELARFVDGVAAVDGPAVAAHLRARLGSPAWHAQARALAALEALMTKGASSSAGAVAVSFQADPAPVLAALNSSQAAVRGVAGRVAGLLGVSAADAAVSAPKAAGGGGADLLGDLLSPAPAAAAAAPAAVPDLMAGFGGSPSPAPAPADAATDLLGGLSIGPPAARAPAPAAPARPAVAADPFASTAPSCDPFAAAASASPAPTFEPFAAAASQPAHSTPSDLLGGVWSAGPPSRAGSGTPPPGPMAAAGGGPMRGSGSMRRPAPADIGITTAASADASFGFVSEAMKSAKK